MVKLYVENNLLKNKIQEKDKCMPVNDYENRNKVINDIINGMDMSDIVSYVYNSMQDYYEARGDEFQEEWQNRFGINKVSESSNN